MKMANWVKGRSQVNPPRGSLTPRCLAHVDPHMLGAMLDRGYRPNASMLAKIEHMEVQAGLRPPVDQGPIDLSSAWAEAERRRDPKVKPITGYVQWSAAYPRDRHDPKRGCLPGSEDQSPETCDGCHGERREGFVCLRCLPLGPERARDRREAEAQMRHQHAAAERKASKARHGNRFKARHRSETLVSSCVDED